MTEAKQRPTAYCYAPQAAAVIELLGALLGGVATDVCSVSLASEMTAEGAFLIVLPGNDPPVPGTFYEVARDRGLVVLSASDHYRVAKGWADAVTADRDAAREVYAPAEQAAPETPAEQ